MSKAEINTTSLFIDKTRSPSKDDQGVMDIGKNCSKCNQLDFLPFQCEFCNQTYCSNHRTLDSHECIGRAKFNQGKAIRHYEGMVTAKSLFPDRDENKRVIDQRLAAAKPKPTTILEKSFRVGDVAKKTPTAWTKLSKFLQVQKGKGGSSSSSIGKLFKKDTTPKTGAKNKVVDMALLRKSAKGDIKVPVADRIYVWSLFINPQKSESESKESEDFSNINVEKDRKPLFVSKNWPVGRALDSIADQLHIRNFNNSTNESDERLNIFKLQNEQPTLVQTSARCATSFQNCDTIYLVKGSI